MTDGRVVIGLVGALATAPSGGCDGAPTAGSAGSKAEPATQSEPKSETKSETKAVAKIELAPAPEGTVVVGDVYVHTCAAPDGCPSLLQDAGAKHCRDLTLGGHSWRLPTLAELEAWKGNAALSGYDVFHWSGSAWDEDPAQFWIFDPGSGSKTTAKPDRKPFTIRCVGAPVQ